MIDDAFFPSTIRLNPCMFKIMFPSPLSRTTTLYKQYLRYVTKALQPQSVPSHVAIPGFEGTGASSYFAGLRDLAAPVVEACTLLRFPRAS